MNIMHDGPFIGAACDASLAPDFGPGGQYEGQILNVHTENAAALAGVVEEGNQQTSHRGASDLSTDHEMLIKVGRSPYAAVQGLHTDRAHSVINVNIDKDPTEINKDIGRRVLRLLDAREKGNRISMLKSVLALPAFALASVIGNPKVALEYTRHLRRLHEIKPGNKANDNRLKDAARLASRLPDVVEIA